MPARTLISIATYNERDNLASLIDQIHEQVPSADVLVVDDNSPDGTGRLAEALAAADPRVHVLHRPGKLGLGTAILTGMRYAIARGYDYFVNMDADFSHDPRYLPILLEEMKHRDVMIGSRYVPGGGVENWPWKRELVSRAVNALARFLLRLSPRDTSGGYRCYRVAKLRSMVFEPLRSRGYSFQQEMLYRCCKAGCRLGEIPIVFADRRAGQSKVNLKEVVQSLRVILGLGCLSLLGLDHG